MDFSIITPSYKSNAWLKLCIASVADQHGVTFEHIVQDSCSDDGTLDWLPHDTRVKAFVEKDQGMYDAINRGYRRASGNMLAYLNSDEQYLPGSLATVKNFFDTHPKIDMLVGGTVVVDADGQYVCHRPALVPHPCGIWFRFQVLTSSIFIRRHIVQDRNFYFDTRWRALGDLHWVATLIQNGVTMDVVPGYQSCFAETGENLGLSPAALRETNETWAKLPLGLRLTRYLWVWHHFLRRWRAGHLNLSPGNYEIYTKISSTQRRQFHVGKPTTRWRSRN